MSHGGKRAGAGRKPRPEPLEAITIRINPEYAERFKAICKSHGISQASQIVEWIKRARL